MELWTGQPEYPTRKFVAKFNFIQFNWRVEGKQRPLSCLFLWHDLSRFKYNTSLKIPFYLFIYF